MFLQGAGPGAHQAAAILVKNLRRSLGPNYEIIFPPMPHEADPNYQECARHIEHLLAKVREPVIIIAHSVGASILLKYLSKNKIRTAISGIFIMAAPFWGHKGWTYDGYKKLELPKDLAATLPKNVPVFLYQCQDDAIVPYEHLALYTNLLPHAVVRPIREGGHQFNNQLSLVAEDIKPEKLVFIAKPRY